MTGLSHRVLIVNADDFGLSHGVNEGVVQAFRDGIVRSTSLMVHQPAAHAAAVLAHDVPGLGVGLHFDLGEWAYTDGEWIAIYQRAPLDDGPAVTAELARQLDRFRMLTGQSPTHLDSHQHVHLREPVRSIVADAGRKLQIPVRHLSGHARYCGDFYGQDETGQSLTDRLTGGFLMRLFEQLQPGVTELCCHPSAAVDVEGMYRTERLAELRALCEPAVVEQLQTEAIELRSFGSLR